MNRIRQNGFTLVELIVAVALFSVVMLVSVAALLALVNANRKAQALQSVMNNLNIALDGMVRNIRMGSTYDCVGGISTGTYTADCPSVPGTEFMFESFGNIPGDPMWIYKFVPPQDGASGFIERSEDGGKTWEPLTAPEVSIKEIEFYVVGTQPGDTTQPKVVIVVKGTAGIPGSPAQTTFHIQATAVQRVLDI